MDGDVPYMKLAIKEAKKAINKKQGEPFGCCIVKDKEIVGKGYNTVLKTKMPTRHAEINAIEKACKKLETKNLSNCILYITSEPCLMCVSAIRWAGIKKIIYGTSIKDAKEFGFEKLDGEISQKLLSIMNIESGILRDDCYQLFLDYEKIKKRNTNENENPE